MADLRVSSWVPSQSAMGQQQSQALAWDLANGEGWSGAHWRGAGADHAPWCPRPRFANHSCWAVSNRHSCTCPIKHLTRVLALLVEGSRSEQAPAKQRSSSRATSSDERETRCSWSLWMTFMCQPTGEIETAPGLRDRIPSLPFINKEVPSKRNPQQTSGPICKH